MKAEQLAALTNDELLAHYKNFKPNPTLDAFLIGFLVGIIVFSVVVSSWGIFSLLPLLMIYALLKKPKQYAALKKELKKRNLMQGKNTETNAKG